MSAVRWLPFPDAEAIAGEIMRTAGVTDGRVYSSVPARPEYPLVTFARLGGIPPVERVLDRARIQVEAWGNNKSEARAEADSARRALHEAEGTTSDRFGGSVTGVEDEMGLTYLPDPETNRDRYVFAVGMFIRPVKP